MSGLRKQTPVTLPPSINDDQTRRSALRNSPVRGREARRPSTAKVRRSWRSTTRPLCADSKANAFPWSLYPVARPVPDCQCTEAVDELYDLAVLASFERGVPCLRGVGVGVSVVEMHQQLRIIGDGRHGSRLL